MEMTVQHNGFTELSNDEACMVDGGFFLIITGMMVVNGLACLGAGVAVGYAIGKIIK